MILYLLTSIIFDPPYCNIYVIELAHHNSKEIFSCFREVEALIQELSIPPAGTEPLRFSSEFPQDSLTQFKVCYQKQNLIYWRSPQYNVVRLFFTTMAALIFGSIFWNVGSKRYSECHALVYFILLKLLPLLLFF